MVYHEQVVARERGMEGEQEARWRTFVLWLAPGSACDFATCCGIAPFRLHRHLPDTLVANPSSESQSAVPARHATSQSRYKFLHCRHLWSRRGWNKPTWESNRRPMAPQVSRLYSRKDKLRNSAVAYLCSIDDRDLISASGSLARRSRQPA